MATTIAAATLTVTLTEAITLNGQDKGSVNTLTIASITEVSQRIVEIPTTEITILSFGPTNPGAGAFDEADVRYIRLTNKDDANFIQVTVISENNNESVHKLEKGHSVFIAVSDEGVVDVHDADSSALSSVSFDDITSVTALANTAACDLELFVAGV
jgi:hypothetical protein